MPSRCSNLTHATSLSEVIEKNNFMQRFLRILLTSRETFVIELEVIQKKNLNKCPKP